MTSAIPPGSEGIIPHLIVEGAAEAVAFYAAAFGAEVICQSPGPDGRLMHAEIRIDGRPIYIADDFPEYCGGRAQHPGALGGSPVTVHRYVEDCDAAIDKAVGAGGTLTMPAADMFWGDRYGKVTDPFGHVWSFATHVRDMTPEEMEQAAAAAFG